MMSFYQFLEQQAPGANPSLQKGPAVEPIDVALLSTKLKKHIATHGKDSKKLRGKARMERDELEVATGTQERKHRARFGTIR